MSFYFRVFGSVLVVAAALLIGRRYASYTEHRLSEAESFRSLLLHIKSEINRFLTPTPRLFSGYEDEVLSRIGFLPAASELSPSEAFLSSEGKMSIGGEMKRLLNEFFAGMGREYKDGEIARVDAAIEALDGIISREREELPKNVKLVRSLLVAAGLGTVILLI